MIVTCSRCPRQLCFVARHLEVILAAFGWRRRAGEFLCAECAP